MGRNVLQLLYILGNTNPNSPREHVLWDSKFVRLVSKHGASETGQAKHANHVQLPLCSAKASWISGRVFLTTSAFRSWHLESFSLSGIRTNLILEQPGINLHNLLSHEITSCMSCQHSCLVCNSMWNMQMWICQHMLLTCMQISTCRPV